MSDPNLIQKLESLPTDSDFSDPQTYTKLLYGDGGDGQGEAEQTAQGAQADTAPAPPAASAAAPAPPADNSATAGAGETNGQTNVDGVLTRDGKHFLPFRVLETARQTASQERQAREAAEAAAQQATEQANAALAEVERLKAGQADTSAALVDDGISDAQLAKIDVDFPEVGQQIRSTRAIKAELERLRSQIGSAAPVAPAQAPAVDPGKQALQDTIDQLPLLAQWQAKGGVAWQTAVEMDRTLSADPAWATRTQAERFAEVQKLVASEFGIPVPSPAAAPAPVAGAPAAATPSQPREVNALPTLTDFNGTPATLGDPMTGKSVDQMRTAAYQMDEAQLRALAGLSY